MEKFFDSSGNIKGISTANKVLCEAPITLSDVEDATKKLKLNKSPGTDGLTSEMYKLFSRDLARFLHKVYIESIDNKKLPPSLTQGLLTLIPKPQKDSLLLDNWRPKKLKNTLDDIIDETQSGFMNGRHITNNIRLVLDVIDYSDLITNESCISFFGFL